MSGYPFLTLTGTARERGYQYGSQVPELIKRILLSIEPCSKDSAYLGKPPGKSLKNLNRLFEITIRKL